MTAGIPKERQVALLVAQGVPKAAAIKVVGSGGVRPAEVTPAPRRGRMNKLESRYAAELEVAKREGGVKHWKFEPAKFCIADGPKRAWYTPDFLVEYHNGLCVFEEVKGFWREAARVRVKVVAAQFPMFRFRSRQPRKKKDGGGWKIELFSESEAF